MTFPPGVDKWASSVRLVFIGFALIAAFFVLAEHRAHVLPFLPWLLLAACPLMHLFMHHGHGHDGHTAQGEEDKPGDASGSAHSHGGTSR